MVDGSCSNPTQGRPRIHCTAESGWMSDPNGLVKQGDTYHLYYQHNPFSTSWGPMHWGHATSRDLIAWDRSPIALSPDNHGLIFSGSAVLDENNSAEFGRGALIALFTYHGLDEESQGIASSTDGGVTFTKAPEPILRAPEGWTDFRDPRVFWYEDSSQRDSGHWVMLLAAGRSIEIYVSANLRSWTHSSSVTDVFSSDGTWEMPELLSLVDADTRVWVLVASIADGAPGHGSGVQAVAGEFDGVQFTPTGEPAWIDFGSSFYAPQAWNNTPPGKAIWIGWMGNWRDVTPDPALAWHGQMSIPRALQVAKSGATYRLIQTPIDELSRYRRKSFSATGSEIAQHLDEPLPCKGSALDLSVSFNQGDSLSLLFERKGTGLSARFALDPGMAKLTINAEGAEVESYRAPRIPMDIENAVRVILDTGSIEIFAGPVVMSTTVRPLSEPWSVTIGGSTQGRDLTSFEIHKLEP